MSRILLVLRFLAILCWVFLTMLLLLPNPLALFMGLPVEETPGQGYEHLIAFGGLACCVQLGLSRWERAISDKALPLLFGRWIGMMAIYALATELLQILVPKRTFGWEDLLQNFLGILAGTAVAGGLILIARHTVWKSPQS